MNPSGKNVRGASEAIPGGGFVGLAGGKELLDQCEKWFVNLAEVPDGVVLTKQGALAAVRAAASHFASEMNRLSSSPESSKVTQQLKDIADESNKAAKALVEAVSHLREINRRVDRLGEDSKKRLRAIPSPVLQLLNDSVSSHQGLIAKEYEESIKAYGDANISVLDRHLLRSEILRRQFEPNSAPLISIEIENQLERLESIEVICKYAATLPGIANSKGGRKKAFQEFRLYPTYQLVEACLAILKASNLPHGKSKVGLLFDLSTAIRQCVVGPDAKGMTRAIEDLSDKTSEEIGWLGPRVDYWVICLLIRDLQTLELMDPEALEELSDLKDQANELHALLSWKATPRRVRGPAGSRFVLDRKAFQDINEISPFGKDLIAMRV